MLQIGDRFEAGEGRSGAPRLYPEVVFGGCFTSLSGPHCAVQSVLGLGREV